MECKEWRWKTPADRVRAAWPFKRGTFRLREQDDGRWAGFNRLDASDQWVRLGDYESECEFLTYVRRQGNWELVEEVAR